MRQMTLEEAYTTRSIPSSEEVVTEMGRQERRKAGETETMWTVSDSMWKRIMDERAKMRILLDVLGNPSCMYDYPISQIHELLFEMKKRIKNLENSNNGRDCSSFTLQLDTWY